MNISQLGSSSQWELRTSGTESSKESKKPRLGEPITEADEQISAIRDWLQQTELQFEHSNKSKSLSNAHPAGKSLVCFLFLKVQERYKPLSLGKELNWMGC